MLVREALAGDPRFQPELVRAAAPFVERVAEILADGVERGEVRNDLAVDELALLFSGMCELALTLHWGAGGGWPALEDIPKLVTSVFLSGATARPAG